MCASGRHRSIGRICRLVECADLGGQDEVAFREAVDLMGPDADGYASPGQDDLGGVILVLGNRSYGIGKGQSLLEVAEGVGADQMMLTFDRPFRR